MLFLKNLAFTVLVPGTVAVFIPYRILASSGRPGLDGIPFLRYLGLAPLLFGGAIYLWSQWGFARIGRGTPAPIDPPKTLVVEGPYRFTRNPMYVAVFSVILGQSALFASGRVLAYGLLVLAGFQTFVVLYEEPRLRRRFGPSYDAYCASVPRWLYAGPGLALLALVLAACLFVALKLYALHPVVGDENIYFYLAARTAEGEVPYRDFPFAHPILHLYAMAAIAWATGKGFVALKVVPAIFTLLSGLVLYRIGRHPHLARHLPSPWGPVLAAALFWFSFDALRISSHPTGPDQATFLILLGVLALLNSWHVLSGVFLAGAVATATYVAPLAGILFLWLRATSPARPETRGRIRLRLTAGFLGALVAIHLPSWIVAPEAWFRQTVLFHLEKPEIGPGFRATFHQFLGAEGFQAAAAVVAGLGFLSGARRREYLPFALLGLLHLVPFLFLNRVYIYYFFPAFPFLALGAAAFLLRAVNRLWESGPRLPVAGAAAAVLALQPLYYLGIEEVRRDPWKRTRYEFRPTPGIGPVNRLISALFPETRVNAVPYPGILRYLWHESRAWEDARALAEEIRDRIPPEGTLYGDSTTTPLLAFLSGRRIACDLADTNTMQFRTGLRSVEGDLACARGDGLRLVVVQPGAGITRLPEFNRFLEANGTFWKDGRAADRPIALYLVGGANPSGTEGGSTVGHPALPYQSRENLPADKYTAEIPLSRGPSTSLIPKSL